MAEVEVRNTSNDVVEQLSLADEVFDYSASETLVWEAVRAFLANQRKGTHSTKNRRLVRVVDGRFGSRREPVGRV